MTRPDDGSRPQLGRDPWNEVNSIGGMTKREEFAARIIGHLSGSRDFIAATVLAHPNANLTEAIAGHAVQLADALIEALNRGKA